jgi:hypothetical protein
MSTMKKPRRMARPPYVGDRAIVDARLASGSGPSVSIEKRSTKQNLVLGLLQLDSGASLADLVAATNWLPHTTRAALTGLRKKGHIIGRNKVDGVTRYAISSGSAE